MRDKMDKVLERHKPPKHIQGKTENMMRLIFTKIVLQRKFNTQRWILTNILKEITSILYRLLQKTEVEGITCQLIPWGQHYSDTKTKDYKKRKLQTNIPEEHRCKNSEKIFFGKSNSTLYKADST